MQTIYSFAGASATYLTGFPSRYPRAERLALVRNYRSTPQVIAVANAVARQAVRGSRGAAEPVVLRPEVAAGPPVTFAGHADEVAEAAWVSDHIKALREAGTPLKEIAVLFRINAQSETIEEALAEQQIPYVMRGAERFFERPEVKQAVTLLRGAARGGSAATGDLVADTRSVLSSMGWADDPPAASGVQRDRWESLQAVITVAADVAAATGRHGLAELVAELDRRAQVQHMPVAEGVTLATLHSAKGLEWDAVFLAGMHEGAVPIVYATTPAAVEEERRLFYVGLTRARTTLAISWSRARTPGARGNRGPTRFLDGIRPSDDSAPATGSGGRRGGGRSARTVARCRGCDRPLSTAAERKIGRCSVCPASYDEELFDRLRAWRSAQAREQRLPAYCVFTDATLVAIAEMRPADARALVTIPGIGQTKATRYGGDVVALCAGEPNAAGFVTRATIGQPDR